MRIALLTDGIHPYVIGGMQMHSFYLAKYFAKAKIEVDLYHPFINISEKEFLACFLPEEEIYIHPIFVDFPKKKYFPGHYIVESYKYSQNISNEYFRRNSPDFIYAQGFTGWELLKKKKKKRNNISPIGVNFHGLNMFQPSFGWKTKLNNVFFKPAVKYNLLNADCVFSLGTNLSNLISHISKNIIEIPIGIDNTWLVNEEEITNNDIVNFIFVGRYDVVKGIDILNNSLKKLIASDASFMFNFVGPFPAEGQINDKRVKYFGEIKNKAELKNIVKKSDVIVLASYSEGMPTVIIEAMACGLAVLSTNVGVIDELVDDGNGILIIPGDSDILKKALSDFIKISPKKLLEMKLNSRKKVELNFLWDKIISKTIYQIEKFIS
ncbi:MAG: hypothetical protein A3F72_13795 [Bacteroidetes bacterium RIFCSPLOWO2_12_FULL_35_15]|nr:MAG: hypothetical protein A3F72_13795 [Bacteroidetes bacterium RIFCSPLOWO2_12_FULL_35_15]